VQIYVVAIYAERGEERKLETAFMDCPAEFLERCVWSYALLILPSEEGWIRHQVAPRPIERNDAVWLRARL
jgi:hypothetical protein